MIARNRILLNLINKSKSNNEDNTQIQRPDPPKEESNIMIAPEPEEEEAITPQQEFKEIIKLANKKTKGIIKTNKKRKKIVKKLIEFLEENYMPLEVDEMDIF